MRFFNRFQNWCRELFRPSNDIPLRIFIDDGRVLHDKHPLVRHGLILSLKHEMAFPQIAPSQTYRHTQSGSPPQLIGREYVYAREMALDDHVKLEAMNGFLLDGEFGIDHRNLVGSAWKRPANLSRLAKCGSVALSIGFLFYALLKDNGDGFWRVITASQSLANVIGDALARDPHWMLKVLLGSIAGFLLNELWKWVRSKWK